MDYLYVLFGLIRGIWRGEREGTEPEHRARTAYNRAMYVAGAAAVLLAGFGWLALNPDAWWAAAVIVIVVIPVLGLLDHRAKVRRGLYSAAALAAWKRSMLTWGILLLLAAAVAVGAYTLL